MRQSSVSMATTVFLMSLFSGASSLVIAQQAPNLALNRPVSVSSVQAYEQEKFPGPYAVDGDTATRWSSEWADPQWICIDLGSRQPVNTVTLFWEAAFSTSYEIQLSADSIAWATVFATTACPGGREEIVFADTAARYVRIAGFARSLPTFGMSLWEVGVYKRYKNLALNKTVTVSSVQEPGNTDGPDAVDGSLDTRWSSNWNDGEWIYVDLGSAQTFNMVQIYWEPAYPSSYEIQTSSNATAWTALYRTDSCQGGLENVKVTGTTARYVRILSVKRATTFGISIWELGIYKMPDYGPNLALKKPALTSSAWLQYEPAFVNDGRLATAWQGDWADTQWVRIDLGTNDGFDLVAINWDMDYGVRFAVEASNDTLNWRAVYIDSTGVGGLSLCPFTGIRARYVRVIVYTKAYIGNLGILELEVYRTAPVPEVGVFKTGYSAKAVRAGQAKVFGVTGGVFVFPKAFSAGTKAIAVYALNGRLVKKAVVKRDRVDLGRELGLPRGNYVIRLALSGY